MQVAVIADPKTVMSLDDVVFGYDREVFTPPGEPTIRVVPQIEASHAQYELLLNGEPLQGPTDVVYGEYVLGIKARATGSDPRLSGAVLFADYRVGLDRRWRAAPMGADDGWARIGFDDRKWDRAAGEQGIWSKSGSDMAAFRRVVLCKSSRVQPWRQLQWQVMHRDRMFVAEGAADSFVIIVGPPSKTPSAEFELHVEAPAFMRLLDKKEQGSSSYANFHFSAFEAHSTVRDGAPYNHLVLRYQIPVPYVKSYAPLYFKIDDRIAPETRRKPLTFTFWREAGGNITDVPEVLPITVVGPINGRQCRQFNLEYNSPGVMHSGGFGTYSTAERYALADTLIKAGMNVAWVGSLSNRSGVLDYYLWLRARNVRLVWGFNFGMNYPAADTDQPILRAHPEINGQPYRGDPAVFAQQYGLQLRDLEGRVLICQEICASGDRRFYDPLRPQIEEAIKKLGKIEYVFWDWEYDTLPYSTFNDLDKRAFERFSGIRGAFQMTDQEILSSHAEAWKAFRFDQTARHVRKMIEFCREYGTKLTVWHPGPGLDFADLRLSPVKDVYRHHFAGWPGSSLPLHGAGRSGMPGIDSWSYPDLKVTGQSIVDVFPSTVIDERMFKIWTVNMALATRSGGWVIWLDAYFAFNQTAGQSFFMGEATRLIHDHEPFFQGSHIEDRFQQEGLAGQSSGLVALQHPENPDALVLLFNEGDEPVTVTVTTEAAKHGWKRVSQWEGPTVDTAEQVAVSVPSKDVVALRYTR